jgi:hypothetical protein
MIGHLLRHFQLAAIPQVFRDSHSAKAVTACFCAHPGIQGTAADHAVNIRLSQGFIGELFCAALRRAEKIPLRVRADLGGWLHTLIQEVEAGSGYKGKVRTALQRSYRAHYRQMLPELLNKLEYRCTNTQHQPVMEALKVLKTHLAQKGSTYPKGILVPIKGVVSSAWLPLVVEEEDALPKINRIVYEICILRTLREQLRCREIWVVGSRRYRDPEEDLPQDFEERKGTYWVRLNKRL